MPSHAPALEHRQRIIVSAVERGMLRRTEEDIRCQGIDEKSSQKGHSYVTILSDINRSRVLELIPERSSKLPKRCLKRHSRQRSAPRSKR